MIRLRSSSQLQKANNWFEQTYKPGCDVFFPIINILLPLGLSIIWSFIGKWVVSQFTSNLALVYHQLLRFLIVFIPVFSLMLCCFWLLITDKLEPSETLFKLISRRSLYILGLVMGVLIIVFIDARISQLPAMSALVKGLILGYIFLVIWGMAFIVFLNPKNPNLT